MPAPKGNKFALGNKGGQPRCFESVEEFKALVDSYFKWCEDNPIIKYDVCKSGENAGDLFEIPITRPYLIEGLATHLGVDRKTLLNYSKMEGYEEYFHVMHEARQKISTQMFSGAIAGTYNARFVEFLTTNNTEYKNKSESEIKHSGEINLPIINWVKPSENKEE